MMCIDNIMKYRNSAPIMMMMNPVIIARLGWDPLATTIVLYSHYDVVIIMIIMKLYSSLLL